MQRAVLVAGKDRTIIQLSEPIGAECPKCNASFAIEEVELPDASNVGKIRGTARHECKNCGIEMIVEIEITGMALVPATGAPPTN